MTNYMIRRFFQMMIVVLLSSMAIYLLLNIAPGGPLSGLRLSADRKSRVTDQDIARLSAYLGLDKPLLLRYFTWLVGDDWLGADWMYIGLSQYKQPRLGKNNEPLYKIDPDTGERTIVYESTRFWTNPGPPLFNPAYKLWVWGAPLAERETIEISDPVNPSIKTEITADAYSAEFIQVKPPAKEQPPEDVMVVGEVRQVEGHRVVLVDANDNYYVIVTDENTEYQFPEGEGESRPEDGIWWNISWLTGVNGVLTNWSQFHGDSHGILRLDFGTSWRLAPSQPVTDLLASRLPNTIRLMAISSIVSLLVAIPIGIYSGVHQYTKMDYAVTTFAFFGSAMPVFWFGLMLILVFAVGFKNWGLPYMPFGGVALVRSAPPGSLEDLLNVTPGSTLDHVIHIVLPAAMLALLYMAGWSRYMRSSMLEVLRQDYVRTARAKGLLERAVIYKHALRNALIPIITIVVFQIPGLFGGATLTETVFSYPGIGRLYFDALGANDWPIVMAILFITAILVVFATLLGDLLYTIVDPRIRFN